MKTLRTAKSKLTLFVIATALIPFNISNQANARPQDVEPQAAGDLDVTFGDGGRLYGDLSTKFFSARAVALQPDGKIVTAGSGTGEFEVARLNSDGSLDSTFGSGGSVETDFGGSASASALAIQTDGRIIVAGFARKALSNESADFALARYNTDGSLDASFGIGGKVTADISGHADLLSAMAIQSDGRILAGGVGFDQTDDSANFELVRFEPNGALDTTFGLGGKVVTDFVGFGDSVTAMAIQSDGRIVAAGGVNVKPNEEMEVFGIARYNADGSLDQSFGTGGKVTADFAGTPNAIALRNDGKIIVGGSNVDFALVQYNPDGTLDPSFANGGKVFTDFAGFSDVLYAIAIQPDGKILASGSRRTSNSSDTSDYAFARYNADGSLDSDFGVGGKVATDFFGLGDQAYAVVLQPDGKAVLAGYSFRPTAPSTSNQVMSLARYVVGGAAGPGFSLAFDESPVTGERGTTVKIHLLINRTGGFTGNVTITPPPGSGIKVKVKPAQALATGDDSIKFKLKIKAGATVGHYSLTFTGNDDAGHVASATVGLFIQ